MVQIEGSDVLPYGTNRYEDRVLFWSPLGLIGVREVEEPDAQRAYPDYYLPTDEQERIDARERQSRELGGASVYHSMR